MPHTINDPRVMAEFSAEFERYNAAIDAGDVDSLNGFFWNTEHTVRFGPGENLFGYSEIALFRGSKWRASAPRRLVRAVITTIGEDFATASALFQRDPNGPLLRQTQAWSRFPEGWRIVAAHVSSMPAEAPANA